MSTFYKINGIPFEDYYIPYDLYSSGGLWLFGRNGYGQLGNGITTGGGAGFSSPVQTVAYGTNWKLVSGGRYHTAAIKTDGTLWSWGHNTYGSLGDNTTTHRSSPVQTVTFATNWKSVSSSSGSYHTAAIKTDGTLWLWGYNNFGQIGDNTRTNRSSPVQTVTFGTNWKSVACGDFLTAAIKTDGTLWLWGRNTYGQLGDNTTTHRSSPVQTVAYGTNWKSVGCGFSHPAAIKTDGTLWLWGNNYNGALGDNTTTNRSSPVQTVAYGTNWKSVVAGRYYNAAIKTDGTLWLWGDNSYGMLGDNTTTHRSSPVQTVAYGTNWKLVSGGSLNTAGIKTDGTLWLWGRNISGEIGDNTTTNRSSPVQTVAYGTNWKLVSCGGYHNAAIRDNS